MKLKWIASVMKFLRSNKPTTELLHRSILYLWEAERNLLKVSQVFFSLGKLLAEVYFSWKHWRKNNWFLFGTVWQEGVQYYLSKLHTVFHLLKILKHNSPTKSERLVPWAETYILHNDCSIFCHVLILYLSVCVCVCIDTKWISQRFI